MPRGTVFAALVCAQALLSAPRYPRRPLAPNVNVYRVAVPF